ncbi:MAG TPA: hypothetical protein VIF15_02795 [Polyangiaceae bacterium]|jgi:hypothetical protein
MRRSTRLAVLPLLAIACGRRDPPVAPDVSPSTAAAETASPPPASATVPVASASSALPAPSADPALLPQTHDQPSASGAAFEARVAALWAAVVEDDPERAMPFFFPLGAYEQVKDIGNPAADWKHRLVAAYTHDVHALHARLGDDAAKAKLVALEVPEPRARWVDPGEEYNKIGYYRVFGSRLRYEVDGAPRSFEVKSLISWRGEWYVVHLSAIK